jgi:hypothetical protein
MREPAFHLALCETRCNSVGFRSCWFWSDLSRGSGASEPKPLHEQVSFTALGGVQRGKSVKADPIEPSTAVEQYLGGALLSTMACAPKGTCEVVSRRCIFRKLPLEPVEEAQAGRLPQIGSRAVFDQATRGIPLTERDGIRKWGAVADHTAGRLEVGPGCDQRIEHVHVVAAGCPVEGRFSVSTDEPGIHVCTGGDEQGDRVGPAREVTWPIGDHVERSARACDAGGGQLRVPVQQRPETPEVSLLDRTNDCRSERVFSVCHKGPPGWQVDDWRMAGSLKGTLVPVGTLESGPQLVLDLPHDARGELRTLLHQKTLNLSAMGNGKRPNCPGHRLDHHVVAVVDEQSADCEGTGSISGSTLGPEVQGHGAHQGNPSPPAIRRARPICNRLVGYPRQPPGASGEVERKAIDLIPALQRVGEPKEGNLVERAQRRRVKSNQLVTDEAMHVGHLVQGERQRDDLVWRRISQAAGVLATDGAQSGCRAIGQLPDLADDLIASGHDVDGSRHGKDIVHPGEL